MLFLGLLLGAAPGGPVRLYLHGRALRRRAELVDDAPYVVAHVTIDGTDDRVRVISNVIDVPWEKVHVGMRVRVRFEDVTPEITLPKFAPLEQG